MQELKETLSDIWIYFYKAILFAKPVWIILTSIVSYVILPDAAYVPAFIGLIGVLVLDIITKYYSVGVLNGGILNAIRLKKLTSESLWRGTKRKIISITIIMILCGLSYRVTPISSVAVVLSLLFYTIAFWREAQSVCENMIDAGHEDLRWLLLRIKKKQKEIEKDNESTHSTD